MTKLKRTTLLVLLGASLAAGCGSDDEGEPIPADSAATLQAQLDNIQARMDNGSVGACEDVLGGPRSPNVEPVEQTIADLPTDVSEDVRAALQDGFDRLFQLVDERCNELRDEAQSQQDTEAEAAPEPEQPETETIAPPETETVPPPETVTETVPPPDTGEQPTTPESGEQPPAEEAPGEDGGGAAAPTGAQG